MVSEDSDQLVPGLASIHRFGDTDDLQDALCRDVSPSFHELNARRELLEVSLLRRPERKLTEERNDPLRQIAAAGHDVLTQVLLVVVVTPVDEHPAAPEELLKSLERGDAARALRYNEPRSDL